MDFPWQTLHLPLIHPHHQHHQPRVATSLRPRPAALAAPSGAAPCAARAGRSWRPSCSSAPPAWHGPGGAQRMLLGWGKSGGKCGRKMSFDTCLRCVCILMYFDRFDLFYVFLVRRNWAVDDLWCRSDVLDMVDFLICGLLICFDRSEFWIVLGMDEWCILCLGWNWWIIGELSHTPVVCVYFGETCQNNVSQSGGEISFSDRLRLKASPFLLMNELTFISPNQVDKVGIFQSYFHGCCLL